VAGILTLRVKKNVHAKTRRALRRKDAKRRNARKGAGLADKDRQRPRRKKDAK
jgi:hypothetical protein